MKHLYQFLVILAFSSTLLAKVLEPKSEIRFGYGMLFDYHGHLVHGLNRYHLMVGIDIPDVRLAEYYTPRMIEPNFCDKFKDQENMKVLYTTCRNVWPAYRHATEKVAYYKDHIDYIVEKQLPAVIPGYRAKTFQEPVFESSLTAKVNRRKRRHVQKLNSLLTTPQNLTDFNATEFIERVNASSFEPKVRHKRFLGLIGDIIGLGIQAASAYDTHRKQKKILKGMKHLAQKQQFLEKKIIALEDDMMSLARATLSEIEYLKSELQATGMWIRYLAQQIKELEFEIMENRMRIVDNSNAIVFLSGTIAILLSEMERYLALYQRIATELDHLLDALDNLSNNLLSHTVVPPEILEDMILHVQERLSEKYPEYQLVIDKVHEYYNLPLVSFAYKDGMLGVQIPLFIKPRLQEPLYLYDIRTIPVPLHVNKELMDEDESIDAYTQIPPTTEVLAMSSDTYINIQHRQLKQCVKISAVYFCEQLFLMKHNSEHTCESAIYHNQTPELIKEKCEIQYFPHLDPEPDILDAGNHLLLGNLPLPWTVICNRNDQIPSPIEGSPYVIIDKADLCLCSISAGTWYIQENIIYCTDEPSTDLQLKYTVNMAVMLYQFEERIKDQSITDLTLYEEPAKVDPKEPVVLVEENPDVLDKSQAYVSLREAMDDVQRRRYATKQDAALANDNPENWFRGDNKPFGFVVIGTSLAVLSIPVIYILVVKFFGLKASVQNSSKAITKILGTMRAMKMLEEVPTVSAFGEIDNTFNDWELFLFVWKLAIFILVVCAVVWLIRELLQYWNIIHLLENSGYTVLDYLFYDRTDICIQFQDLDGSGVSICLGTIVAYPENIDVTGHFLEDSIVLDPKCIFDSLRITWDTITMSYADLELKFPNSFPVPMICKPRLRKLFRSEDVTYRLIAYNARSTRTRPLTPVHRLHDTSMRIVDTDGEPYVTYDVIQQEPQIDVQSRMTVCAEVEERLSIASHDLPEVHGDV